MPRPKSITDEQIREAARAVFLEHGPAATVAQVAERLGVSHAALFQRTGSKARLMVEALAVERPRVMGLLDEAPPKRHAHERLVELLVELHAFFARLVPGLIVLRAAGIALPEPPGGRGGPPPPVALRVALATWLRAACESGAIGRCEPEVLADALLGAMEARCFNAYFGGRECAAEDDLDYVRRLVAGLVPTPRTRKPRS